MSGNAAAFREMLRTMHHGGHRDPGIPPMTRDRWNCVIFMTTLKGIYGRRDVRDGYKMASPLQSGRTELIITHHWWEYIQALRPWVRGSPAKSSSTGPP
jgi:threonine 3-dehydrogenase